MSEKSKAKPKRTRHRSGTADKIVGGPSDLPVADLPLLGDVLAKAKQIKSTLSIDSKGREVFNKAVIEKLYLDIAEIYHKSNSNLVLISEKTAKLNLTKIYTEYKELVRSGGSASSPKMVAFQAKCDKLFDLIICKCKILSCEESKCDGCEYSAHINCSCKKDKKIPRVELLYVMDQRSRRGDKGQFQIADLDKVVTSDMQKTINRKAKDNKSSKPTKSDSPPPPTVVPAPPSSWLHDSREDLFIEEVDAADDHDLAGVDSDPDDHEFIPEFRSRKGKNTSQRNMMILKNIARECMRWGVSPKAGASIANAALIDAGVVTKEDQMKIIDKSKLKRQMEKYQNELREKEMKELQEHQPEGIYFDGKKDDTLTLEQDERGVYKVIQYNMEHYTLGIEPGGQYLGHLEPDSGKAVDIRDSIIQYLGDNGIDGGWKVVGTDSTSCITGNVGGAICLLEKGLGRKLHWSICILHTNELPLRHLFTYLDGPTTGANSFKGVIGKKLPEVSEMEWNPAFKPISAGPGLEELPEDVFRDLSSDQKYLYLTVEAVRSGIVPDKLKCLTNGPISHSRWLTLASTITEMYMKKHRLSVKAKKNLETIVHFIVTNYAPMWFSIKCKPSLIEGPKHYFMQVQLLKLLPKKVQEVVKENTDRSAYHAHPENILLAMLADDNQEVRGKAVDRILGLRQDSDNPDKGDISVRKFVVPAINYSCKTYYDMIDFDQEVVYEPNLTADLTVAELHNIKLEKLIVKKFSNNNQGVERLVKQTSRACQRVVGWARRDGYLRASAKSRAAMPKFDSKKDFKINIE